MCSIFMGDDTTFEEETKERYGWGDPRHVENDDGEDAPVVEAKFHYECLTCSHSGNESCACSGNLLTSFGAVSNVIEETDRATQQALFDRLPLSPTQRRDIIDSFMREESRKQDSSQINLPKRKRGRRT